MIVIYSKSKMIAAGKTGQPKHEEEASDNTWSVSWGEPRGPLSTAQTPVRKVSPRY